jgi:uncharacterized coiled-coil protein SlyX
MNTNELDCGLCALSHRGCADAGAMAVLAYVVALEQRCRHLELRSQRQAAVIRGQRAQVAELRIDPLCLGLQTTVTEQEYSIAALRAQVAELQAQLAAADHRDERVTYAVGPCSGQGGCNCPSYDE